jgi:hypothetical protein
MKRLITPRTISFGVATMLGLAGFTGVVAVQAEEARQPEPRQRIDPRADALLRKMSTDLAGMKRFSFDAEHTTEVVTKDGEKIHVLASSSAVVQRPANLRSDRRGPRGAVTLYYDGNNLTVYGARENLYATTKAPGTLDKTIDFAREDLGLEAPAADLLYTDAYSALMEDVVSGTYVDDTMIDGRVCHHLAYRGNETDWQIWIEDGPRALPCRFVITSKKVTGMPEYTVELRNWKVNPALPENEFAFTPPRGAGRIDFLAAAKRQEQPTKGGGA